jgi:hypothetical protein
VGADQLDEAVLNASLGNTVAVGLDVSQVTDVAVLVGGSTVGLSEGVEVRAGGGTAVGVVTELVDVHSTLGVGIGVLDLVFDDGGGVLSLLSELDDTRDTGITADDSNCAELELTCCFSCKVIRRQAGKQQLRSQQGVCSTGMEATHEPVAITA